MNRQRPRLRNGVDLQLQSAFQDGNWSVVVRLAEKRARTFNDQYYEIVKVCAESQLDDPVGKYAAVGAVWQYVKDGTVVKDVGGLDLLEWATLDFTSEDDFAETLGPLRVRCAKASPKDKNATTRCLESCLLHWDLVSAQQIAALIDRSFPQERSFMFWNIVITYMLSTSPQSSPEKKKLYGTLAQKQIERASQLSEQTATASTGDASSLPARSIQTEEEVLLLYDIVETIGSTDDFQKLIASPVFSPLAQFRRGRKEPFRRAVARYQRNSEWDAVFQLCKDCLSDIDEEGRPTLLASDWAVWKQFILAAKHMKSVDTETRKTVQDVLLMLIKSTNLRPIYRRNVLLARVSAAFNLASVDDGDVSDGKPSSLRLQELINYVDDQCQSAACFDDIKTFLEELDADGMKYFAYQYKPGQSDEASGSLKALRVQLLLLKLQYFVSTCPTMYNYTPGKIPEVKCAVCGAETASRFCGSCLSTIASAGLRLHESIASTDDSNTQAEILPELAMVVGFCHLKLAFQDKTPAHTALPSSSARHLLRALLILEHQLSLTPKHSQISLILVQLHILLGSGTRARDIWETLGVKRTIVDSLAPLFYDRLSTVAPGVISPSDDWGWELVNMLKSHYATSLKLRMPKRLIDAFEAGSYSSVLEMPKYIENLRASCTRVMSLVEGVRAERLLDQPYGELLHDSRFTEVPDDLSLNEVVDYGSFPSWDCSSCAPVYEQLRVGPGPSNRRSHLSLLSETFHDVLFYKPPTVYRVTTNASGTDQIFVVETMSQLSNSFSKFLYGPASELTASEAVYFQTLSLMSTIIPLCTSPDRSAPMSEMFEQLTSAVKTAMETLRAQTENEEEHGVKHAISALSSMHGVTMLRDTGMAVKLATQWILALNEREKERDRSSKSNLPKDVIAQLKSLQTAAEEALKAGKQRVAKLKGEVALGGDFGPHFKRWVFEGAEDVGAMVGDARIQELVKSWRENVQGWQGVKWE